MSITPEQAQAMIAEAVEKATAPLAQALAAAAARPAPAAEAPPAPPAPVYTRTQLDQAVSENKITAAEANALWDRQQQEQTAKLVKDTVREAVTDVGRANEVTSRIAEYTALKPEVLKEGSPERARVKQQFDYLVSIGQPATKATELVALGMIYGQLDTLKAAHSTTRDEETHQEVGGGAPSNVGEPAPKLKLSKDEKRYYGDLISKGIYSGWDAVAEELKFASARVRSRHGAPLH